MLLSIWIFFKEIIQHHLFNFLDGKVDGLGPFLKEQFKFFFKLLKLFMELFFPEPLLNFLVRGIGTFLSLFEKLFSFLLNVLGLLGVGEEG